MVMKEGVVEDFANKEKIAKLLRFATNKSADATQTATLECSPKLLTIHSSTRSDSSNTSISFWLKISRCGEPLALS
jgi:HSP90 family molecular chaperone